MGRTPISKSASVGKLNNDGALLGRKDSNLQSPDSEFVGAKSEQSPAKSRKGGGEQATLPRKSVGSFRPHPKPVLFLDVDGVLNSAAWFASQPPMSVTEVDPRAVRRIKRIVERAGAKIVLSSSWRHEPTLLSRLIAAGIPIEDVTPRGENRGQEIAAWLAVHPEVTTFAIVDDDADAGDCAPERFVRTYWRTGMYGKHERAVIALLLGDEHGAES